MKTWIAIVCVMSVVVAGSHVLIPDCTHALSLFTDQAGFRAALGNYVTEDFEDEPLVGDSGSGAQPMLAFDDFTATSQPDALKIFDIPWYGNHNLTPGGRKYLAADTDLSRVSADVALEFDHSLTAFGINLIDLDYGETGAITINGFAYEIPPTEHAGVEFFGIIDDTAFTSIHLDMGQSNSFWSMDDIDYQFAASAQVPEPTTVLLVGMGLLGMIGLRRKRQK